MLRAFARIGRLRRAEFGSLASQSPELVGACHTTGVAHEAVDPYANIPHSTYQLTSQGPEGGNEKEYHGIAYRTYGQDSLGQIETKISMEQYFVGDIHHTHKVFSGRHMDYKQGQKVEQKTFVDLKMIRLSTGSGGNGCVSFFRDAHRPVGPPDGGDGGDGGNIYVQAKEGISSLHKVKRSHIAGDGRAGTGSQLDGRRGEDVILEVPVGTTLRWIPDPAAARNAIQEAGGDLSKVTLGLKTSGKMDIQFFKEDYLPGEGWQFKEKNEQYHAERDYFNDLNREVKDYDREIIAEELMYNRFPLVGIDFDKPSEKPLLLMRGGKGGMGNMHFLTPNVRNPRFSKKGRKGITENFLLELKLIADLGLVGLPNAGKSTLLRAISKARPRVGHWEFTTLQPTIGTIFTRIDQEPFTVADIPGIIKGASENKGMGMDFLRHIERSGGLVFVVSLESENAVADLTLLIDEIGPRRMKGKKVMVIATKADLVQNATGFRGLQDFIKGYDNEWLCIPVCAPRGENIEECIHMMGSLAEDGKKQQARKERSAD